MNEQYNSPSRNDLLSRIVPESDLEWVNECDKLLTSGDVDEALHVMYNSVDARLKSGDLDCDFLHRIYHPDDVPRTFAIGILTSTKPILPQTEARIHYFEALATKYLNLGEDPMTILAGLD